MIQVSAHAVDAHWWTVFVPTDALSAWTAVLALATLGVGFVAYFGLRSLALSKADMRNRAIREETQCAIDRCNEMGQVLLPKFTSLVRTFAAKKVRVFVTDPAQVSFRNEEEEKKLAAAQTWIGSLDPDTQDASIDLLNRLECWSIFFTTNPALADEAVAFDPCSTVFCQMVMMLYGSLLAQRRANPASGPYQNVVKLFSGWYAKKAQGPMLEQIKRLQSDGQLPPTRGNSLDEKG
jgi:hypothetical protein